MSSIASTVFGDSLERVSLMVRLTAEMSLSDWAELADMQRNMAMSDMAVLPRLAPMRFVFI